MQASNEELQSTNEELRSTMEELETSKEELQSMNEELITLNQENRHRVEELTQLSDDLHNLMASSQIATLFLDLHLRIVRFTPPVIDLFNIRSTDRGRPLADFTNHLGYPDLQTDARRVLDRLVPIEREVRAEGGRSFLTRVLPYRAGDNRIDGVVITLIDVTDRRNAEEAQREIEEQYRKLVSQVKDYAIFRVDLAGRATTWNVGVQQVLGFMKEEFIGQDVTTTIFTPEDIARALPAPSSITRGESRGSEK
jgi:two-component system CheB/CheR fusion protein